MTEDRFNMFLDIADGLSDETDGYFPTVDEMMRHHVEEDIKKRNDRYTPILIYLSSDPFSDTYRGRNDGVGEDYRDAVKYARDVLYRYEYSKPDDNKKEKAED